MAGKKNTSEKSASKAVGTLSKSNGRAAAAGALTQAPIERRSGRNARSRRMEPTADDLGLRAWKTTYENKHTKAR